MGFRQDPNPLREPAPQKHLPASGNITITQPPRLSPRRSQQSGERRKTVGDILIGEAQGPLDGIGIFLGRDGEDFEFRAGDPDNDFIHWDGFQLNISGSLTADSGNIGGWLIEPAQLSNGNVKLQSSAERLLFGAATAPLTGVGIFIGLDGADYEFRAGDPNARHIHWDGAVLTVDGTIIAAAGIIGGWTIGQTALFNGNMFFESADEHILIGAATGPSVGVGIFLGKDGPDYEFRAGDPAGARMHWDGTNLLVTGMILKAPAPGSSLALQGWVHDLEFTAVDNDTVNWTSGTITLPSGDEFFIVSGTTGPIADVEYVFLDLGQSSTVLQETITAANAVGADRILIAVTKKVADVNKKAEFIVYGGGDVIGLGKTILADVIAANTITFNELAGNTITANEIDTLDLTTQSLTATVGAIGGWILGSNTLSSGNISINSSTEQMLFGSVSAFQTGVGIFIGLDSGTQKFRIGDPNGASLYWNGADVIVEGSLLVVGEGSINFVDGLPGSSQGEISARLAGGLLCTGVMHFGPGLVGPRLLIGAPLIFNDDGTNDTKIEGSNGTMTFDIGGDRNFTVRDGANGGPEMRAGNRFITGGSASGYIWNPVANQFAIVVANIERVNWNSTRMAVTGNLDLTGTMNSGSVPAARVNSGTLADARIPSLNASKITAGTFVDARIPSLNASKINAGTFADARIPNLNASKITAGSFADARIPNLNASKTTAGEFNVQRIPNLNASKIKSGLFSDGSLFWRIQRNNAGGTTLEVNALHTSSPNELALLSINADPNNTSFAFLHCRALSNSRMLIYANGNCVNSNNSYGQLSDRRLKQGIVDVDAMASGGSWDDFLLFRFRKFKLRNDVRDRGVQDAPTMLGVIGQEMLDVSPGLVVETNFEHMEHPEIPAGSSTLVVQYSVMYMKGMVVIQELQKRCLTQEITILQHEAQLADQETRISDLETSVAQLLAA